MNAKDPKFIALQFNEYINAQDIDGLSGMMTNNHTFIDSGNEVVSGKKTMVQGWRQFFDAYPDYRNIFSRVESRENLVIMVGHSTCSNEKALEGPAIWTARIENDLVAEWRIYLDNEENRKKLVIV